MALGFDDEDEKLRWMALGFDDEDAAEMMKRITLPN